MTAESGPLDGLPRVVARQVELARALSRMEGRGVAFLDWLGEALGTPFGLGTPEISWRAAGLRRPGAIAQLAWPRKATRVGLGVENAPAHAVVDRLLGFDRLPAEGRLQISPVEWGILAFVLAESLARLGDTPGALGPWDLVVDRVGPEAFDPSGLGDIVTVRWPSKVGAVAGSVRLWLPATLAADWLAAVPEARPALDPAELSGRFGDLVGNWHAEAGTVVLPRGLARLRVGSVLPLDPARLSGSPRNPTGAVELALRDPEGRSSFPAVPVADSAGARLRLTGAFRRDRPTREAIAVSTIPNEPSPPTPPAPPTDVPVTLTVELGRINLPLRRLAELRPGDVVELGRHAREPVELTSGGRLVARGELVQVDTELGVRITGIFL
ncbi:MAG TPA: type III secretion system cytoplasmic ring protein SctQ [Isosphaeraceae bacterium]|jgi:type III secretion system YscQ/HrcQ family protein|nr:type III secretion system cytoplasmic ring protein SctQ [Isosphaeraceae bacterium]